MSDNGRRLPRSPIRRRDHKGEGATDLHPALYTPLEREGGALLPDPQARVGLCPLLAQLSRAHEGHVILPSLLQPASPSQLPG